MEPIFWQKSTVVSEEPTVSIVSFEEKSALLGFIFQTESECDAVPILKHHATKAYGGVEVPMHYSLPWGQVPRTPLKGGFLVPKSGAVTVQKALLLPAVEPGSVVHSQSLYRPSNPALGLLPLC
jgi:hypothetical protein